ncbi:MAG: TIGR04372 family glycosyltransferase, partial [Desulfobulbaceae bacterium]|nr:TIGR04372 family glycosyltransferase [Desulfobulbaceae bacterium]
MPGPLLKVVRWLYYSPDLLFSIVVSLILRALCPVVLVRFGKIPSQRIGHFALEVEAYLCARDTDLVNQNIFDVFFYDMPICNQQLKKMWDRTLCMSWPGIAKKGFNLLTFPFLPGGKKHWVPLPRMVLAEHSIEGFETYDLLAHTPTHLRFTPEESRQGFETLRTMGVPEGSPFVCFHARDTAYYTTFYRENERNFRNSNIYTRLPAVEELTHCGYWGLRMGAAVETSLQNGNPRILDYATTARTDFLDIFLVGTCRFYLGDSCGLADVAVCFRRPVVWVNWIPLTCAVSSVPNALFLPKKLWLTEEHRFMTFREMSAPALTRTLFHDDYFEVEEEFFKNRYGIEFIENTP